MAKILYGVAGEGAGHAGRAKVVIRHLMDAGHEVKVVSYDKGYEILSREFDVTRIDGLRIAYQNNKVQYLKTALMDLEKFPDVLMSVETMRSVMSKFKPNLVFCDFEPISNLVANLFNIPCISIDNMHIYTNTAVEYPKKYEPIARLAKIITRLMIPRAKAFVVTTFFSERITKRNTFLVPPIVRSEVLKLTPTRGDYILMYTTSNFNELLPVLQAVSAKKFIVYGASAKTETLGNVTLKPFSYEDFLHDFAGCEAIIATAGFSLISEALYLGKPYLAIPVAGQFEQVLNGVYLEKMGYGKYCDEVKREYVEAFLYNIERYYAALKTYPRQNGRALIAVIDTLVKKYAKKEKRGILHRVAKKLK